MNIIKATCVVPYELQKKFDYIDISSELILELIKLPVVEEARILTEKVEDVCVNYLIYELELSALLKAARALLVELVDMNTREELKLFCKKLYIWNRLNWGIKYKKVLIEEKELLRSEQEVEKYYDELSKKLKLC